MRLLLTRPLDESRALADELAALGHRCIIEPMLSVTPVAGSLLDLDGVQAILLTSANGARALASHPSSQSVPRDLPVLAVGAATGAAARDAGFHDIESAGGNVVMLAELVRARRKPEDGILLHVAGTDVAGDLAGDLAGDGFEIRRAVLYKATKATGLSQTCVEALADGALDGVVLFSPRSAAAFATLVRNQGLDRQCAGLDMYALSDAVAGAAEALPWRTVHVAKRPEKLELLALLRG